VDGVALDVENLPGCLACHDVFAASLNV